MSLFSLLRNKENPDQGKDRKDLQLEQYKELLKGYRKSMEEYTQRLRYIGNRTRDDQATLVHTAMDLSQIKSQNEEMLMVLEDLKQRDSVCSQDQTLDQMESLMATIIETNYKIEEMDKGLNNNLNSLLYQIKEEQDLLKDMNLKVKKTLKGNRGLLWVLFLFQFVGLAALAFIILYLLDYIYI